ncbi:MAG: hypothetical protein A2152_01710 [Candidatus Levybacteria bacterium RBG_16_35_6]|nr:MAG: hypothetical protein A2152_01710 [Candidatus Levybacteria bacterium RBG_16_35_6]
MRLLTITNRVIEYFFYLLIFSVPLYFSSATSELFEFNKLWLTFGITIIIVAAWIIKMVAQGKFKIQRTIFDIPIGLFLLSQIISTIVSIDPHTSIWGYYSRFNGGLLSILSYVLLYYAFVSNLSDIKYVKRILKISLVSGLIVSLWGLPSHFGYDPTCLLFRGTFDVSCWTADFQPKIRIFSTLGQPDWLSAYLAILIPVSLAFSIEKIKEKTGKNIKGVLSFLKTYYLAILYLLLSLFFYLDLIYTASRSGVLAIWTSLIVFAVVYFWLSRKSLKGFKKTVKLHWAIIFALVIVILITFIEGDRLGALGSFSYPRVSQKILSLTKTDEKPKPVPIKQPAPQAHVTEFGGTDSTKIRAIVWAGALKVWQNYPLFGSGTETFAFSYYQFRPAAHNLTSEWNFLYNKAHNEYLNYMATTGTFGILTYLSIIFYFIFIVFSKGFKKLKLTSLEENKILTLGLFTSFVSILITNFFGFSVVIVNIYFFLILGLTLSLLELVNKDSKFGFSWSKKQQSSQVSKVKEKLGTLSLGLILVIIAVSGYFIYQLIIFREADKAYAYGYNLDRVQQYQQAYSHLHKAYSLRPGEPVIADETAYNDSVMAVLILQQGQQDQSTQSAELAQKLAQEAVSLGTKAVTENPNNIVFWKTQTRIYYTLAQADPQYLPMALEAIKKAASLAPTDANIHYNLGILYGQNGDTNNAIKTLDETVKLKSDYRDAHYALGIFYHQASVDKDGKVIKPELNQKAIDTMKYILSHIAENDTAAKDAIKTWSTQ